jgi:hypothetical protein
VPPALGRILRSTKQQMISIARTHCHNVRHWQNGQMALRWWAAGMAEAGKQFRRVNGHPHLPALREALKTPRRRCVCTNVGPTLFVVFLLYWSVGRSAGVRSRVELFEWIRRDRRVEGLWMWGVGGAVSGASSGGAGGVGERGAAAV